MPGHELKNADICIVQNEGSPAAVSLVF